MKDRDVLETLELIAADQWGIVTTAQAAREGVTRLQLSRLNEDGVLQRARRGVYFLPSNQDGPLNGIRAAWVALEPKLFPDERSAERLAVSHQSATVVHRIGQLIPNHYTFTSSEVKRTAQPGILVHSNGDLDGDVVWVDGLPVTSVERTIADMAANYLEREYLAEMVADGLRRENVQFSRLKSALRPHAAHYGEESGGALVAALESEGSSVEEIEDQYTRLAAILKKSLAQQDVFEQLTEQIAEVYEPVDFQRVFSSLQAQLDDVNAIVRRMDRELTKHLAGEGSHVAEQPAVEQGREQE